MSHISLYKCYNGDCTTCVLQDQKQQNLVSCVRYERRVEEYPGSLRPAVQFERPRQMEIAAR